MTDQEKAELLDAMGANGDGKLAVHLIDAMTKIADALTRSAVAAEAAVELQERNTVALEAHNETSKAMVDAMRETSALTEFIGK